MTKYVILRNSDGDTEDWTFLDGTYEATSARRALAAAEVEAGEYVAVPARSWRPLTVKSETVTKITIG